MRYFAYPNKSFRVTKWSFVYRPLRHISLGLEQRSTFYSIVQEIMCSCCAIGKRFLI